MNNKLKLLFSLFVLTASCQANAADITGTWQCQFKSGYIDADQVLTIKANGKYSLKAIVFGSAITDIGNWKKQGAILVLHRTMHISRTGQKKSDSTQQRQILKLTSRELVLKLGRGISTCSRQ